MQASTVQKNNLIVSWLHMYLPVLYTYSKTAVEFTEASQKSKLVSCKMHAFYQNAYILPKCN